MTAPETGAGTRQIMRRFEDEQGRAWEATLGHREDGDYKGSHFLVMTPVDGGEPVSLQDIRWNSERTARRTLETMSVVELRRRLRSARGRSASR